MCCRPPSTHLARACCTTRCGHGRGRQPPAARGPGAHAACRAECWATSTFTMPSSRSCCGACRRRRCCSRCPQAASSQADSTDAASCITAAMCTGASICCRLLLQTSPHAAPWVHQPGTCLTRLTIWWAGRHPCSSRAPCGGAAGALRPSGGHALEDARTPAGRSARDARHCAACLWLADHAGRRVCDTR